MVLSSKPIRAASIAALIRKFDLLSLNDSTVDVPEKKELKGMAS